MQLFFLTRFLYVPAPHNAEVLADALKQCIQSWNLDLRLASITVDNCTTNDAMMNIIKDSFPYGSLLLDGEFLHMRCCAHILNLIVQDGLNAVVYDGVNRIRESVVFWTGSDKRVQKFEGVANQLASGYKRKLTLDCKIRWNSTYEMLCVAINYKEVFAVLSGRDKLYKNPPTPEDWEKVGKICELLEVFAKLTLDFSASKTPTANIYFSKICKLKITLSTWLSSPYDYVVKMAEVMLEKYKKYWDSMNGLMGVATILDPRYKMALIRFYFAKLFDKYEYDREVSRISNLLRRLVDEYESRSENTQSKRQLPSNLASGGSSCDDVDMEEFAQFLERDKNQTYEKSDLDKYLENANIPLEDNFDILNWWKTNGSTYPVLQQVARDILSIPISTVPSESAFSTSGRVLDPYRSRLLPQAVEALMCSQNWIWAALKSKH